MGRAIIKIKDLYFIWSTVVDAPVTYGMTEEQLYKYTKEEYGRTGLEQLPEDLKRVTQKGASWYGPYDLKYTLENNRAGPDESELTEEEIYDTYSTAPKE